MYQLCLDSRDGSVTLDKIQIIKETKLCFFFNTSTTAGCIYKFEKRRLNNPEHYYGSYYIIFEDINFFGES